MKPEILLVNNAMFPETILQAMHEAYVVHEFGGPKAAAEADLQPFAQVQALATTGWAPESFLKQLPGLRLVSSFGVGYDGIAIDQANEQRVAVTNTPEVLNEDVADLALALLLAASRGLVEGDRYVREGRWPSGWMRLTRNVSGRKLGILGLGRIGLEIARRAEAFRLEVSYHNRNARDDVPYRYHPSLVEMAREVDYLVIICVGGPATQNLVNREVLEALGPEGILVNVSRGSVVDEGALVQALESGTLGGAGLDVFAREPHVPEELIRMPHVVLQPHQGSATVETRQRMGQLVLDNLEAYFAGRPLLTQVNPF